MFAYEAGSNDFILAKVDNVLEISFMPRPGEKDHVREQFVTGRGFRVLYIVKDVTRKCLRAVVDTSIAGRQGVRELTTSAPCVAGRR